MPIRFTPALLLLLLCFPGTSVADTALIIGNSRYDEAATIRSADDLVDAMEALETNGFTVISGEDLTAEEVRARLSRLLAGAEVGRIIIALTGHFAVSESTGDTWFLGREVNDPDLATVGASGIALTTILEIAARAHGRAVVLLGTEDRPIELGTGLQAGIGSPEVPQGVTLITGPARDIARFAQTDLLEPGLSLGNMVEASGDLTAFGFLPRDLPFLDLPEGELSAEESGPNRNAEERALWNAVQELNTEASYQAYLGEYPNGPNARAARNRIAAFEAEPGRAVERAEDALSLTRAERQAIQRNLSLLDFNPRGIDGIFGPGSRSAIADWQRAQGYDATGFVDQVQVARLSRQADARADELELEARMRAAERERADRAYWEATGAGSDEVGLRAYLEEYPDGVFSDVAEDRLEDIEAANRQQAEAQERRLWDDARERDQVEDYVAYLQRYPQGIFAGAASDRIEALQGNRQQDSYAAAESALNLSPATRQLIEQRLSGAGVDPGRIDGTFDNDTRRALRRYQQARDLNVTGFVDQGTVVRLLADAVGAILR